MKGHAGKSAAPLRQSVSSEPVGGATCLAGHRDFAPGSTYFVVPGTTFLSKITLPMKFP